MTCGQLGCEKVATHRVFWPGNKPIPVCEEHAKVAQMIANGLGAYVQLEELKNDSIGEGEGNS